ncbi:MAG: peptidase S24 [Tannerella sp.]|jgi:phage repressor protein C with HTH and peptisase S24 domain|nr:peptidase S24 [Tannerella sp.]
MEKISPIKDKILQFLEKQGISKTDFCEKTGISYANMKGKGLYSEIGGTQIGKILSYYSNLSPEWLLTGRGEMLRETKCTKSEKTELSPIPQATDNKTKDSNNKVSTQEKAIKSYTSEGIPLIPISAMAGFGPGEVQVMEYECERYVVPMFKDAEFLIQVKGSSMVPKYSSGDVVACKKIPLNDLFFQWNKVYVLDTIQGALVKRVKKGTDNDHILIVSDNQQYEPFELHKNQIHSVAIVVGVIRLE